MARRGSTWKRRVRRTSRWIVIAAGSIFAFTLLQVVPFRWVDPPTSAFMLRDRWLHGREVAHRWVDYERIAPALAISVVAAEDQKFPTHHGFDLESIEKARKEKRARRRGASTITQQLAKNLYLWPGRSLVRKGLEAYYTVLIESTWPKRRILEVYLNVVEFGPGVYGAGAAAEQYFGKEARRLTPHDSAVLTAVLPNPKRMSARRPSQYVLHRAVQIQWAVASLGGASYLDPLKKKE